MARPKGSKTKPLFRTPVRFKQSEIERAIRSVRSMGLTIAKIEISPTNGTISITPGKGGAQEAA